MAKYFGTNGIRGKFDLLNPQLALRAAQGIGIYFERGKVLVARDARLTGETLKFAVISGLQSVGCEVIDLDLVTAPTAEFALKKLKADGLIIITASHNTPEWNALKVIDGQGVSVSKERGEEIENIMESPSPAGWDKIKDKTDYEHATKDHITAILTEIDTEKTKKKALKLVLDCGNGTSAVIAPDLLKEMGCEITLINSEIDGRFPGRPSEPTEKNVQTLINTVKSTRADAGIAWDGDGDRVIFVDEKGNYVIGDRVYALSALLKLREKKGDLVTTVATSKVIEDVGEKFGVKTIYTKIGAPYLSEEMLKSGAILGGEEVGGVIYPEMSLAKDGFITSAKIVEALCEKTLSEWLSEIPLYHNKKTKIECTELQKTAIIHEMKKYVKDNKFDFIDVDGVRINFDDSWVIVRASGTENYVRVFAEAKDEKKAEKLLEEYEKLTKSFCK